MKIAVLGSTGQIGSRIAYEAHRRGHIVTGISRGAIAAEPAPPFTSTTADLFDEPALGRAVSGHDAIVNAYRGPPEGSPTVADAAPYLIRVARDTGVKRLIFIGGAGALEVSAGVRLADTDGFPDRLQSLAKAHQDVMDLLSETSDLDWTVFSPPAQIGPESRSSRFRVGRRLMVDSAGNSRISYEDFAVAVVDELERREHVQQVVSAAYL